MHFWGITDNIEVCYLSQEGHEIWYNNMASCVWFSYEGTECFDQKLCDT